jgi:hypothetical protein
MRLPCNLVNNLPNLVIFVLIAFGANQNSQSERVIHAVISNDEDGHKLRLPVYDLILILNQKLQ